MTVSNEAVEAAAKANNDANYEMAWTALPEWAKDMQRQDARRYLEAAAPFIQAQALEDAADNFLKASGMVRDNTYVGSGIYHDLVHQARGLESAAESLRARAAALRGQG